MRYFRKCWNPDEPEIMALIAPAVARAWIIYVVRKYHRVA